MPTILLSIVAPYLDDWATMTILAKIGVMAKIKNNISSLLVSLSAKTSILRQNVMINPISSLGQGTNDNLVQCLGGRLAFQELYMHVLYNLGITNTLLSESTNASFSLCHDSRRFPLLALWK